MSRLRSSPPAALDPEEILRRRARRLARRGAYRKAALVLRELTTIAADARTWVTLGFVLLRARRVDDALDALKQGLWLHVRHGAAGRARTVARMILRLDPTDRYASRLAHAL